MSKDSFLFKSKGLIKKNCLLMILFFALSFLSGMVLLKSNSVGIGADIYFHWSRIYEIKESFLNGNGMFPIVATNKFYESGSAVMSMYPYMNLYPIVFISFIVKSFVHLVYIVFILRNFLSLIIAYFSCYSFSKNKWVSFIFSISYVLSTMTLFYAFILSDMGVSSSLIFLPIVLFGTFNFLDESHWKQLSIGLACVTFCHIITAVMAFGFTVFIFVLNICKFNDKNKLKSLVLLISTLVMLTSSFTITFFILSMTNHISLPGVWWTLRGTDFNGFISFIFNNAVSLRVDNMTVRYITPIAFLGLIVSIIRYNNITKYEKQLFWTSLISIFVASSFFPWNLLNDTFIKTTFQFSWRIFVITQLLLCYLFSASMIKFCKNKKQCLIVTFSILCFVMLTQISGQKEVSTGLDRFDFNQVIYDNQGLFRDYLPVKAIPRLDDFVHHEALSNGRSIYVNNLGNGTFEFNLNSQSKKLEIPFIIYNQIKYRVTIDGEKSKFISNKNNQMVIEKKVTKGNHLLQIKIEKSWYNYLSYFLTIVGIIMILFSYIKDFFLTFIKKFFNSTYVDNKI